MLSTKVEPISRDIELLMQEELSPAAQSKTLAAFAAEQIAEADAINMRVTGSPVRREVYVDGRRGAALETVKPTGVVVAEFELFGEVLEWIGAQLVLASPVRSGRYARSHILFADGVEVTAGAVQEGAGEYVFLNAQPYARKIERGLSAQTPDGVYQSMAAVARQRFGNVARISFTYRAMIGGRAVNQSAAASQGQPWYWGGAAPRAATGAFEKTLGATAHNKSNVRQPAIIVRID